MKKYRVEVNNNGTIRWYKFETNQLHREDGPACEYSNGAKVWYLNGELHREDGPAVEDSSGTKEWWINGKKISEEEFNQKMNQDSCNGKVVEIDGKKYKLTEV